LPGRPDKDWNDWLPIDCHTDGGWDCFSMFSQTNKNIYVHRIEIISTLHITQYCIRFDSIVVQYAIYPPYNIHIVSMNEWIDCVIDFFTTCNYKKTRYIMMMMWMMMGCVMTAISLMYILLGFNIIPAFLYSMPVQNIG